MRILNDIYLKKGRYLKLLVLCLFVLQNITGGAGLSAQNNPVQTGVVVDTKGEAIIGASVKNLRTNMTTMTDIDGKFSIAATTGATLRISCIGYLSTNFEVTGKLTRIILTEDTKSLKEVVAIGYGAVKRENLLGSVSAITGKEVQDIPMGNLSQTIVGKLASVKISETTGRPGSTTPLTIRSAGSFATGSDVPVFVIDGKISSQSAFDMIDPVMVESISILKDAAAAVYGARGAGGAVVVTLKRGVAGAPRISYSGQFGYTTPTRFPEMLSASEQARLLNIMKFNSDLYSGSDYTDYNLYTNDEIAAMQNIKYNWLDAVWQNSYQTRHTLNVSGGTEKLRFFAGGSLWNETGNFKNIDVKKYSIRSAIDVDVSDELTASLEISLNNSNSKYPYLVGDNEENMNGFYKKLLTTSYWIPYKVGDLYVNTASGSPNPLAILDSDCYKSSLSNGSNINTSFNYKSNKIKGLSARLGLNYSLGSSSSRQFVTSYKVWNFERTGTNNHLYDITKPIGSTTMNTGDNERLALSYGKSSAYQMNASVSYARDFGKHHFNGMINYEQSESWNDGVSLRYIDQLVPNKEVIEAFRAFDIASSSLGSGGRLGFIGRFSYDYDSKYMLEASFREEASVKFAPGNRWGFFPQMAAGWRISEEPFYKESDLANTLSYLKIRGSAGLLGQDNQVGNYEYQLNYTLSDVMGQYFGTGDDSNMPRGLHPQNNGIQTSGVTWEKSRVYNLGLDTKFIDDKIDFTVEGYYRHTWDIFDNVSSVFSKIVGTEGSGIPKINYGIVNSWGIDVELGYNGIISEDADYRISGNYSWGDNLVIRKYQSNKLIGTWAMDEGRPVNKGEDGYITSGMFRTQEQVDAYMSEHPGMTFFGQTPKVGMLIFEDIARPGVGEETFYVSEKDGRVDEYDLTKIGGKSGPLHAVNMSLGFRYKTLNFDMTITGGFGGTSIVNKVERTGPTDLINVPSYWSDSWTYSNPNAAYPCVEYTSLNEKASTYWLRSSNIIRLRTVNLSYVVPQTFSKRFGVQSTRIMLTGTNLLTLLSDFPYKDANLSRYYDYPLLRAFNLGINISL